jgi:hypothetical protein
MGCFHPVLSRPLGRWFLSDFSNNLVDNRGENSYKGSK